MEREYAAEFFPKKFSTMERKRAEAMGRPLTSDRIASLLSLRFNREPLYKSVDDFYTPEYAEALRSGMPPSELSKVTRYRNPTQKEANLLYGDIHSKEQLYEYSASNASD
ncbi:MAG: hypothetical protein LBB74_06650 [Chitinispirillales bacterium]|jgi:hypothetical protein|nr:hypothetical protein [Chitinispirillales bacterium]